MASIEKSVKSTFGTEAHADTHAEKQNQIFANAKKLR